MARKGRVRDKLVESRIKINQTNKNGAANSSNMGKTHSPLSHSLHVSGKGSIAGVLQAQGVAAGPICIGRPDRKSDQSSDQKQPPVPIQSAGRETFQLENQNEFQKTNHDEYIDGGYLLQNPKQGVKHVLFFIFSMYILTIILAKT